MEVVSENTIQFPRLFSTIRMKKTVLKNRIVFLPHHTALAGMDSLPTEQEVHYYAERARGGAGLIITGNYAVSKSGQMQATFIDASNKAVIPNFTKTANLVHTYGAKIIGQLTHAGPTKMEKPQPDLWSPSQVVEGSSGTHTVQMEASQIKEVVESFRTAALNLVRSDFDGVELKVGHDGLLRAFLSPHYNKRGDAYGGSIENRVRFVIEVMHAVHKVIGPDKLLGLRLCMDEFESDGYGLPYAIEVAKLLEKSGQIDYISTDSGTTWLSFIMQIPPMSFPLGCTEYIAAALRREINLPVIAYGRINDPTLAEQMLLNGSADLIGMARQLVCDPEFPSKAKRGDVDDIRKCIGCLNSCGVRTTLNQPIGCIQNIAAGHEREYGIGTLRKTRHVKNIAIIGGGPAGMKAAEIAAKRKHNVILFEEDAQLGGQINLMKKVTCLNEFSEVVRYLDYQLRGLRNVDVKLNHKISCKDVEDLSPDVVIVATGSTRGVPSEYRGPNAISSWEVLSGSRDMGGTTIIYDSLASTEGLALAEYIFEQSEGAKVLFYTPARYPGEGMYFLDQDVLYRKLFKKDITFSAFQELTRSEGGRLTFVHRYSLENQVVDKYDNFVYLGHMWSNDSLFWELSGKVEKTYRIGDATAPRSVELAIHGAEELCRLL
jgi:2,4-dienoyl-CoA reductase-like NADH-dependent reductase (Old Yellow Enzyme family)